MTLSLDRKLHRKRAFFFIITILGFAIHSNHALLAQTFGSIEGSIVDGANGEPLPGVNILLTGTVLGTTTDLDGHYAIKRIPPGSYKLRITMMGYRRIESGEIIVRASQATLANFDMQETAIETPELVVTANKRRQRIQDSPNSVGVITAKDFRQKNEVYLDKLLEYASGVNFVGSQINIRGSSGYNYGAGSRVLLLIDGVPVMPGDSGDIKWDLIPATQIERVEIIKGAGSALYGSNALGGVVNIITKEASSRPVTNVRFSAGAYDKPRYAEWEWTDRLLHFDDVDVDHTRKLGKSEIFISAGKHQSTGYSQNGYYQRYNGTLKMSTSLTNQQRLTFSTNYEGGDRGAALLWRSQRHALEVSPEAIGDHVVSDKWSVDGFHQWALNKNFGLKSRLSYFRNYWKNYFHDNITASTANKYGLEIQGDWQISESNSLTFGTEETFDHVVSGLVGTHDQHVLSGYAQNERKLLPTLSLTLGLRYDTQHVDVGFDDSEWSPKVGLVWHARPYLVVRASSGKGFRVASMSERFAEGLYSGLRIIPNVGLKSETAWSHEFGLNLTASSNLFWDIAAFRSDYWDLIEPEPDETQTVQFINVTRARISGFETTMKVHPFIQSVLFDIGYTYMDPRDLDLDKVLAYRSKHIFTGSVTYSWNFAEIGFDYRWISKLEEVKVYPKDDRVDQKVANIRASIHYGMYTLSFNANNVFNHNHTQQERTLLPIRHYVATFSSSF
jgi:outer membrane receptor for ferrienterochelin and colicins